MELFLNLCWLSLLLPAWLLWQRRADASARGKLSSVPPFAFFCVLGCALVLLFPVISASDDLHAMRTEMEESSLSKRSVSQSTAERASVGHNRWAAFSAMPAALLLLGLSGQNPLDLSPSAVVLTHTRVILRATRAPPSTGIA